MVLCRNRLGRALWFEQLPWPFTGRNGVSALGLWELLCPVLLLVFGFSVVSLALITELGNAEGVTHLRHPVTISNWDRGEGYYTKKTLHGNPKLSLKFYVACFPECVEGLAAS